MSTPETTSEPNYALAESFLESLAGPAWREEIFTFQTLGDDADRERSRVEHAQAAKKKPGASPLSRVRSGKWEDRKTWLATMNLKGAGVFVTANKTDGDGRRIENIKELRAIWCEWDGPGNLPQWPLEPQMIVETSPGHFHIYWLTDPLAWSEFTDLMGVIVHSYGSDPSAKDASRVLRIPGFYHQKVNAKKGLNGIPHLVSLTENNDLARYEPETLFNAFDVAKYRAEKDEAEAKVKTKRTPRGRRPTVPFDENAIREAQKFISREARDTWLTVGMALASSRDARALALWDSWSQSSEKYDAEDQIRTWGSFREVNSEYEGGVTLGTLFKLAKDGGYRARKPKDWEARILRTKYGRPINCVANMELILDAHEEWSGKIRLNRATGETLAHGKVWQDADSVFFAGWLRDHYRMAASTQYCHEAVAATATKHSFNPITEYLEALPKWDGTERVSYFFSDFFGAPRDAYTIWCAGYFFRALIERAYAIDPGGRGVMVRLVPVLEGPQDRGKTQALRVLGGQWYKEIMGTGESKDFLIKLKGCWVGEMAELETMDRTGLARLKAIVSAVEDKYRPPYGRAEITQRRLAVLVGTTNTNNYLRDDSGNTRFLPIKCSEVNVIALAAARDQLFAEAMTERAKTPGQEWWRLRLISGKPRKMSRKPGIRRTLGRSRYGTG